MNPYEPPATVEERLVRELQSICVGSEEPDTVSISSSLRRGVETFVRDTEGNSGPVRRRPVELKVGKDKVHTVRIAVDNRGEVNAFVDDALVGADLLAKPWIRIWQFVPVFRFIVGTLTTIAMLYLVKLVLSGLQQYWHHLANWSEPRIARCCQGHWPWTLRGFSYRNYVITKIFEQTVLNQPK